MQQRQPFADDTYVAGELALFIMNLTTDQLGALCGLIHWELRDRGFDVIVNLEATLTTLRARA